jgi:cytoskeletal protein CcmA (bactofilin family)
MVADQEIKGQRGPIRELKTCGQIVVKKRGRLICQHIVAHAGLTCEGIIDAKTVTSGQKVVLGPKSNFKGDLTAPAVDIADGAKIQPSRFAIGEAMSDPDEAEVEEDTS